MACFTGRYAGRRLGSGRLRTLLKNKQSMKYALQIGEVPIYNRDENGNKIPSETGEPKIIYGTPQEFDANIAESGGEAEAQTFGLSVADYEAVALYSKGEYPIVIGALVWRDSEPKCEYEHEVPFEIENDKGEKETVYSTVPDEFSADFRVIKTPTSQNFTRAILKAIVK